jgi:transglutaminase-like putative cysteine protease
VNRRDFLRYAGAGSASLAWLRADEVKWRTFEVTTRVEILKPSGTTRVWLPASLIGATPFQRTLSNKFTAAGGSARMVQNEGDRLGIITAEFPRGAKPVLTLISRVATRDYSVDFAAVVNATGVTAAELQHFRRPTKLLPTDGIVKDTALEITKGATTELDKARAIYEWVVDNTFRNPKTRGCGIGDIRFMLESRDLGGKCADLNALFVGLARAAGLAARDVYGIRVAKSDLGYKSLGASSENITKSQHCRAEFYSDNHGWVPVDPADVRKVALEDSPDLVKPARARLFGSWEMNWMAYNFAHDVTLPKSAGAPVGFLMYPQAETSDGRIDCLDPDNFKYEITSRETTQTAGRI